MSSPVSNEPGISHGNAADCPARPGAGRACVLITGARGLVGRSLRAQLNDGDGAVRSTDLPRTEPSPEIIAGDLLDAAFCRRICEGATTVIHAAARQYAGLTQRRGWDDYFHANVVMTRNLAEAAGAAGVRHFILISSDMVYGVPRKGEFRETDRPRPIGPYGRGKLECEAIASECADRGMTVTVFRPRLILGPGRLGVMTRLFERLRTGRSVPLIGDGSNRYQMVSVRDVAAACLAALRQQREGLYNLGSDDPPSVYELLGELRRRAESSTIFRFLPPGYSKLALWILHAFRVAPLAPEQFRIANKDYVLDTSRARSELGWIPRDSDIDMLWESYQAHLAGRSE